MYNKKIEDGKLKKDDLSFGKRFVNTFTSEKSKLITRIGSLARGCQLSIDDEQFSLKNLEDEELRAIIRLLEKMVNEHISGFEAGSFFGQRMKSDASNIDSGFFVKMTAKKLFETAEQYKNTLSKGKEDYDKLKYFYERANKILVDSKEALEKELVQARVEKAKLEIERNKLLKDMKSISDTNTQLDNKIEACSEEILGKNNLIEELEAKIKLVKLENKTEIISFLEKIDKFLDENQKIVNGEFRISDEHIKEITELLKKIVNKKMETILALTEKANKYEVLDKRFDNYKAQANRVFKEIIKRAEAEYGILISIDSKKDGAHLINWDDQVLRERINRLDSSQSELSVKYENAKKENIELDNQRRELLADLNNFKSEQKKIGDQIIEISNKLLQQGITREQLDDFDSLGNQVPGRLKKLADQFVKLQKEKTVLDKRVEDYEQQLAELGSIITKALLLTSYNKTADFFIRLTDNKYNFTEESTKQLLSIYFCIKADKLGAKGVRDKIFEFVTEKKSKALAKWLESEAPGVFKLENVPGSAIVNIICSTKETTPVLLPDKEWQQILDTPNEYFSSIFFREILSLVGITYKNNENNKLIMKIESELLINSNNPISGFNKALQTIIKALFIETNIVKKHQILKSCWDSTSLNNVSQICPDFDNKRIFINVNPDSRDGFKTSILENANLLETFIEKQVLNYDGIVPYLPKQYLFYQNDFKKILEDGSFKYDNKFKKDFNKVFDKSCLHIENNLFCKPENSSAKYLGDAYPLVSSIIMIFAVLPTFFLQFSFLGAALFSILSIALAVVGGYYVFRLTGRIPRNLRDRRERAFYRELYTDFTTAISNNSLGGKKMVLDFQNQVPIRLLQGKAKYIIYMSGLMKYFKLDLISVKSLDKDWEDVVRSLMYGQMLGNLGNFSLSKEQIHKLSELMSMIVILDILIEQHGQPLEYLLGKVQTYYGLKGN